MYNLNIFFGLTDPKILSDWIKLHNRYGETRIQDTYSRKNYLNEEERYKKIANKKLKEENERLKAAIEYLKKSQSLAKKTEGLTTKEKDLFDMITKTHVYAKLKEVQKNNL